MLFCCFYCLVKPVMEKNSFHSDRSALQAVSLTFCFQFSQVKEWVFKCAAGEVCRLSPSRLLSMLGFNMNEYLLVLLRHISCDSWIICHFSQGEELFQINADPQKHDRERKIRNVFVIRIRNALLAKLIYFVQDGISLQIMKSVRWV